MAISGRQSPVQECGFVLQVLFEAQGRAGKNKAVDLEDMKFHQCVRLTRFENDRTISFIPPDGAFDLMCAPAVCWACFARFTDTEHLWTTVGCDNLQKLVYFL